MISGICPKCENQEIIEAIPVEYGMAGREIDMSVTAEPKWFIPGRNPDKPHGTLRMFICKSCGFTEWWTLDPSFIPIGKKYRTRIVKPKNQR